MSTTAEIAQLGVGQRSESVRALEREAGLPLSFARRIPELDGYRGLAVSVALMYHYVRYAILARPPELLGYLYTSTPLLWSGMEMFFVLSGFLIGGILLDARDSPRYFSTFYIRRFCRLLPIYFLLLGLVALAYRFVYRPIGAPLDWAFAGRMPWYSYATFTQNFWMAKWNTLGPSILAITWSLAVEEQFYLLLPLIVRFVRRSALPYLFTAGIVIAPIVRLFLVYRFRDHLWATYVLLPCRMDALFLGTLCAYYVREPRARNWLENRRTTLWMAFFGLVAAMPLLSNSGIPFTLLWISLGIGLMSLFYATTLLLALADSRSLLAQVMRWPWLASLGAIGYSVYLFHMGIYCFCMYLLTGHGWFLASWKDLGVTMLALAITIVFCKLSFRYIERPAIHFGHQWKY